MAYNFPNSPSNGNTVTVNGITYTYNSTSGAWKTTASAGGGGGGGASVTSSDTAPTNPSAGDLWWSSSEAVLYIYYADADSSQWVQASTPGADGASGLNVTTSDTAPTSPSAGDFWWNSTSNKLYIYYTDANSSQWVQATTPGAAGADGADGAAGADGADGADGATPGRNKIINGNFDVWQRGTSFTTSGYSADRWRSVYGGGTTVVCSQQSFTLGQTSVPNNPQYYIRIVTTTDSSADARANLTQKIENVRTFQGQTVTVSFWAKADAVKNIAIEPRQDFGTGGSPSSAVDITPQKFALSTNWTKYTKTFTIPSIANKTLGTDNNDFLQFSFWLDAGSDYDSRTDTLGNQSGTFEFSQVQIEQGSSATDFEYKSLGEIIRDCKRYYVGRGTDSLHVGGGGYATGSGQTARAYTNATFPVEMRVTPTFSSTITQSGSISAVGATAISSDSVTVQGTSSASGSVWYRATIELDAEL